LKFVLDKFNQAEKLELNNDSNKYKADFSQKNQKNEYKYDSGKEKDPLEDEYNDFEENISVDSKF